MKMKFLAGLLLVLFSEIFPSIRCIISQSIDKAELSRSGDLPDAVNGVKSSIWVNDDQTDRTSKRNLHQRTPQRKNRVLKTDVELPASEQDVAFKQPEGSPMPINSPADCLVRVDGSYGSEEGSITTIYFFYQVETIPEITETLLNGVVLGDIEITLVDFLIPRLFEECSSSEISILESSILRRYLGISANPADFVLRGFECTGGSEVPCFVISGSMTAFTVGMESEVVQAELGLATLQVMNSGGISATIAQVNSIALLNDSLNLATLPPTEMIAITKLPTTSPLQRPRTTPPTLLPTSPPSTEIPTLPPSTLQPTLFPSTTPSTGMPTLVATSVAPSSTNPTISYTFDEAQTPTTQQSTSTNPPLIPATAPPENPNAVVNENASASLAPTVDSAELNSTQSPSVLSTQSESMNYAYRDHESAFEKVPIWGWVLICIVVCGCCTYAADPDDGDEDDTGVNANLKDLNEQERLTLANALEQEEGPSHESEAFIALEYSRKLYRQ